jgi:RNA polymerase sigma-70 factor (ECF subfamily)
MAWIRWIGAGKTAMLYRLLWITGVFGYAQMFTRCVVSVDVKQLGMVAVLFCREGKFLVAAHNTTAGALEKTMSAGTIAAESELIGRILAGEQDLYYELIAPYERMAYVCALSIMQNEAEAEDCTQESFLKAFRHLRSFKGESKFGSWLVRITLNEAKMKLRKLRPQLYESLDKKVDDEDGEYVPQALGDWREIPSEALERKEIREVLETAIKSLPEIYREIFALRDIQGVDVITSAQILGVSIAVVKTRLLRARLQLRDLLQPVLKDSNVLSRQAFRKGRNPWS